VPVGWPVYRYGRPYGSCAVTDHQGLPEATILSRSVAEAQYPHARLAEMGGFLVLMLGDHGPVKRPALGLSVRFYFRSAQGR
jgi:hypothetical protein